MGLFVLILLAVSFILYSDSSDITHCDSDTEKTCSATCGGTKYDVSGLFKKIGTIPSGDKKYNFMLSCSGMKCGNKNISSAVCQVETNDENKQWSCGSSEGSIWSIQSTDPLVISIAYGNGDKQKGNHRRSVVLITVGKDDENTYLGEDKDLTYSFNITVRKKSQVLPSSSGSGNTKDIIGWVLITVGILGFVMYFIIGGVYMFVVKGARGVEVIPNLEFWKSFPFLLKDGFLLCISPCLMLRKRAYEKI